MATEDEKTLRDKLNRETAKISWDELQRYYASGTLVAIKPGLDLIEVACHFSVDNKREVEQQMAAGGVFRPDQQQAQDWFDRKTEHWAVVIAPWVLIQEIP